MGKKNQRRNEAALAEVIEWLEGRLHGMADLLDEALWLYGFRRVDAEMRNGARGRAL